MLSLAFFFILSPIDNVFNTSVESFTDTSYAFPSWIFISVLPFFQAVDPYVFLCHGYSSSSVSSNIRAIISTMFVCILSSAPSTALLICFFSSMIL